MNQDNSRQKKVYFISGLGADQRAYSLMDLSFCDPIFIDWIRPEPKEELAHYAGRLREQIREEHPTVVGLSFGGMLATEMAKQDPAIQAIIISSNKTSREFPRYFRAGKYVPVYQWLPSFMMKRSAILSTWMLGIHGPSQKKLFRQIVKDADTSFTKWAIRSILRWKNQEIPKGLIHIHGTADRLLPYRLVKADYTIKGGTHVLPMDNHAELSELLKKLINGDE